MPDIVIRCFIRAYFKRFNSSRAVEILFISFDNLRIPLKTYLGVSPLEYQRLMVKK